MGKKQTYIELKRENEILRKKIAKNNIDKFKLLSDLTFEGIIIYENGKILEVNQSFVQMTGYEHDELLSNDIIKLTIPEEYNSLIEKNLKLDYAKPYEVMVRKKDGILLPVELESRSLIYNNKKIRVIAVRDISQHKETEKEIIKLSTAIEQSANSIVITDINGNIEYVNPIFCELTGYTTDEILGNNPRILKSGIFPKKYYQQIWQTIQAGKTWKGRFHNKKKNGEYYWEQSTITPIKDKSGKITNYLAVKENITDLVVNEERLSTFINTIPDVICYKDGEGRWLLANNAGLELFCLTNVDYFGKTDNELAEYTDKIYKESFTNCIISDEKAWKSKALSHNIEIIPTINGIDKIYDVIKIPTFYSNGDRKGLAIIGRDITELKKAKEKAEESDRLKTEFFHNMSHEIRTPLNAILGFSGFLSNSNLDNDEWVEYINIIQKSGNQLLQIIDDILEISRLGTKQETISENKVCLNKIFEHLFSIFVLKTKAKNLSLSFQKIVPDAKSTVIIDETKLSRILNNLLTNAIKFTNEGSIEFGYTLKTDTKPAKVEMYVKDTGIGIKPENHEIIFKRFSQEEKELSKKVGGLGLGLSIAKENTELLGGKITLQSEKGKGTTFFVTIPYKPVATEIKSNISNNENKVKVREKQDKYTILIVEDEKVNFLFIEILLERSKLNLEILHAKNGEEAVELCKVNSNIDFVLMDIRMPIITGIEATKLIKEFRPDLPIVAQTAYSTNDEKKQALLAGCDDFISKPIDEKSLYEVMYKNLTRKE